MNQFGCDLCPRGWRSVLPCPGCDCQMSAIETAPTPSCGTQGLVPCVYCEADCPYGVRWSNLREAEVTGAWWDGQALEEEWSPLQLAGDEPALMQRLNDDQYAAATHMHGPLLVTAGAGSGKTTALTARICWLIHNEIPPHRILGITFTRRAAQEMRSRLCDALDETTVKSVTLRTFHALCLEIARRNPIAVGRDRHFSVWDDGVMRQQILALANDALDDRRPTCRQLEYKPRDALELLTEHKQRSRPFPDVELHAEVLLQFDPHGEEAWGVLCAYETLKEVANALDYSDLIWRVVVAAREDAEFREQISSRWDYVQVDEYQDTNRLQIDLLRLLAPHDNLAVVGDDDQAIYGWRGADIGYILRFEEDHPGAAVVHLGQNYRCSPQITRSAASVVAHNQQRRDKRLWSERVDGAPVKLMHVLDSRAEARHIARDCATARDGGEALTDLAVLVRTRRQLYELSSAFAREGLPARVVGITEWWQREDSRLVCAWLRATINGRDIEAGAYLMQRWPRIGIVKVKRWKLYAIETEDDMLDEPIKLLFLMPRTGAHTKAGKSLTRLQALVIDLKRMSRERQPIVDLVEAIYDRSGINEALDEAGVSCKIKEIEDADLRKDHQQTFLSVARAVTTTGYQGIEDLLDQIVLAQQRNESEQDAVTISTIHGAKGLEWNRVWIAGCVVGLLPNSRPGDVISTEELEEERRLFYVAMTRARNELTLTAPRILHSYDGKYRTTTLSTFIGEARKDGIIV